MDAHDLVLPSHDGYIVDYKDLFKNVKNAIAVYTSELAHDMGEPQPEVLIHDRLDRGREQLDSAIDALALLCEPVEPPMAALDYIHYFCGNTEVAEDLQEREPQRVALYRAVVTLVRAYANIADEMEAAGYSATDVSRIKGQLDQYLKLRDIIRLASGESLDLKAYEADMRYLIDTYIEADEPQSVSSFGDIGLMELIVKTGITDAIVERMGSLVGNQEAVAEAVENNVRRTIVRTTLPTPPSTRRCPPCSIRSSRIARPGPLSTRST